MYQEQVLIASQTTTLRTRRFLLDGLGLGTRQKLLRVGATMNDLVQGMGYIGEQEIKKCIYYLCDEPEMGENNECSGEPAKKDQGRCGLVDVGADNSRQNNNVEQMIIVERQCGTRGL